MLMALLYILNIIFLFMTGEILGVDIKSLVNKMKAKPSYDNTSIHFNLTRTINSRNSWELVSLRLTSNYTIDTRTSDFSPIENQYDDLQLAHNYICTTIKEFFVITSVRQGDKAGLYWPTSENCVDDEESDFATCSYLERSYVTITLSCFLDNQNETSVFYSFYSVDPTASKLWFSNYTVRDEVIRPPQSSDFEIDDIFTIKKNETYYFYMAAPTGYYELKACSAFGICTFDELTNCTSVRITGSIYDNPV
ncbi:hypothetical protein SNEBB_002726 [Seison nebaliae]|nr:hypothetical protein SNEBB_002726 [Seison nebaliae]